MVRSKLIFSLLVITAFCAVSVPGFAKSLPPQVRGTYGFGGQGIEGACCDLYPVAFTGTITVSGGWSGNAFGDLICNVGAGDETLSDFIATYLINPGTHQGKFWLTSTGPDEICDDSSFLYLDAQVTKGGALIKFNFEGIFQGFEQVGADVVGFGNMERIFVGAPSGAYGFLFSGQDNNDEGVAATGWLTLATDSSGNVMLQSGEIDCNHDGNGYTSQMFHCSDCITVNPDGTGMMFLTTSGGDDICGESKGLVLDFVMVTKGTRIFFNSNAMYELPSTTRTNSGFDMPVFGVADLQ